MSTLTDVQGNQDISSKPAGIGLRSAVMVYSLLSYAVGMAGLFWLILAMGGLLPYGFGPLKTDNPVSAILLNAGLIALFGLQHTVMARRSFKQKLTAYIPEPVERSSFVLASGLVVALAVWCWQPLPGMVWTVDNSMLRIILWVLFTAGWGYLVLSTLVTNHFELFGLRQAYLYFRGIPYTPVSFVRKWMYTYSRHPMMLGVLIGMWSIPEMSVSHFILSTLLSLYIIIGLYFEEKDLIRNFGDTYRDYKKDIGVFLTMK